MTSSGQELIELENRQQINVDLFVIVKYYKVHIVPL